MAEQNQAVDAELEAAAEHLLGRKGLALKVPAEVRERIHAILRRPVRERPAVRQVWRDLRMKEEFGVGEKMFRDYARAFLAVDQNAACGHLIKVMARLLSVPAEQEDLQEHTSAMLFARLGEVLLAEGQTPEQLVRVADAMAKGQAAMTRAAERRQKARLARGKKAGAETMSLEERVRRIYGVEMMATTAGGRE